MKGGRGEYWKALLAVDPFSQSLIGNTEDALILHTHTHTHTGIAHG